MVRAKKGTSHTARHARHAHHVVVSGRIKLNNSRPQGSEFTTTTSVIAFTLAVVVAVA